MKCKAVLKEIEESDMGATLPVEVKAHLLVCEPCRTFLDERASLRLLTGGLEKVSAPPDFDWRLRARLAQVRSEKEQPRRWAFGFAPGAQAIGVAASITLLLISVIIYRQTALSPAGETQPSAIAATNIRESLKTEAAARPFANSLRSQPVNNPDSAQAAGVRETARIRSMKSGKTNGIVKESAGAPQQRQRIFSTDFVSRGADELATAGLQNSSTDAGPVISLRVPAPQSTQLRLEDGQGTRRTLSSVSFGGQELVERPARARLIPASEKGIW